MKNNNLLYSILILAAGFTPWVQAGDAASPQPQDAPPESKAISFPFSYTGETFGNLSGGYKQGAIYEGLLSVGVQGDLNKLAGWEGGSFLVSGIYPHGNSLTDQYVHDLNGVSNIDAYDTIRLYEAWFQQDLAEGKVSVRIGQILADSEFFVSDNAALFVNGAFGALPLVSQNLAAPVFPQAIPGVRVRWNVTDVVSVQAGVFEGNVGEESGEGRHGLDWNLHRDDGVLVLTEVAYMLNGEKNAIGLRGVYKLGAFYHSPQDNDAFPSEAFHSDAGGYAIIDQQLWRKPGTDDQGLSGFLRIGGAPDDRNGVPFYFDTGFDYKGLIPGRDKDVAGIGFSYTNLSRDLRDDDGEPFAAHHESILEATYKIQVKDWLYVQPDFQYIFNPGGDGTLSDAVVAGIRFNVTF
jgi:porin